MLLISNPQAHKQLISLKTTTSVPNPPIPSDVDHYHWMPACPYGAADLEASTATTRIAHPIMKLSKPAHYDGVTNSRIYDGCAPNQLISLRANDCVLFQAILPKLYEISGLLCKLIIKKMLT